MKQCHYNILVLAVVNVCPCCLCTFSTTTVGQQVPMQCPQLPREEQVCRTTATAAQVQSIRCSLLEMCAVAPNTLFIFCECVLYFKDVGSAGVRVSLDSFFSNSNMTLRNHEITLLCTGPNEKHDYTLYCTTSPLHTCKPTGKDIYQYYFTYLNLNFWQDI